MNPPEQVAERLRTRGMKVTSPRMAICAFLHGNPSHPTAEEIYRALRPANPGLSLSTVYATLEALEAVGEIQSLELSGGLRRFDPLTARHDHAVCRACGKVRDVAALPTVREQPRNLSGFVVESQHIVFSGLCAGCRPAAGRGSPSQSRSRATRPTRTKTP